jgi:hypothetical protein
MGKGSKIKSTPREVEEAAGFLRRLRKLPAEEQRRLLQGMRATPRVRELLAAANAAIRRIERRGCSVAVIHATNVRGEHFVVKGRARTRHRSRIGDAEGVTPSRRLVPAAAVTLEDRYDGMTQFEAIVSRDPPSVTGLQLQELRHRRKRRKEARRINGEKSKKAKNARKIRVGESPTEA